MNTQLMNEAMITGSILDSVKKMLGFQSEVTAFDPDIIMHINAAISTMIQLGVKTIPDFFLEDAQQTYSDLLGDDENNVTHMVKMYLYYKTRISFDPPASATVMQTLKEEIQQMEWRINIQVDPGNIIKSDYPVDEDDE